MNILKLILVFILSFQFAHANLCDFVYAPVGTKYIGDDLKLIGKLNRLDSMTDMVRKFRAGSNKQEVYYLQKFKTEYKIIEGEIFQGDVETAISKWRVLFRKTERSALEAENYSKVIKAVNKGIKLNVSDYDEFLRQEGIPKYLVEQHLNEIYKQGPETYLGILHKDLRKAHKLLGNNFSKYKFVKGQLEELAGNKICKDICQDALKKFSQEVGITSQAERHLHANLIQNRKSLNLATMQKIFDAHPESLIIARRKEFISESIGLLKKYFNDSKLMRRLYLYLGDSAAGKNLKLVKMFKRIFDRRAHGANKGIIDKVVHAEIKPQEKLALLESEAKNIDYNGLLVDFSRRTDRASIDSFNALKEYVSKSKNGSVLLKQLEEAQELGRKIGPISTHPPKNIGSLITTLVVGGAFVTYFVFDKEETEVDETDANGTIITTPDDIEEPATIINRTIIMKYDSLVDQELQEELLDLSDTLTQVEANLSP
jgi:hypothetical protein